jgi:hypothetical protein
VGDERREYYEQNTTNNEQQSNCSIKAKALITFESQN